MKFELKWLAWEITRRCNLSCVHCRSSSCLQITTADVQKQQGFEILEQIAKFGAISVVLSGGEPLLHPHVFEFAEYGHQLGLRMCLATNGTLITDEIADKIQQSHINMVALSLDGANSRTHDDFRNQQGAFAGTLAAAQIFKVKSIPFLINSSFTKKNQHEIQDVYRLAKSLGARAWYLFMVVPTGRGEELFSDLIDTKSYDEILKWHYEMEQQEEELFVRPTCAPHYYRIRFQHAQSQGKRIEKKSLTLSTGGGKGCLAGQKICVIDVEGQVLPCSYFPLSAGNLHQQSLKQIWHHSDLFQQLRDFKAYQGRCGQCEFIKICGGCRARAYAMTSNPLAQEPFCNYQSKKLIN